MIRTATTHDMAELVRMARAFHAASSDSHIPFFEPGAVAFYQSIIASPSACLFIDGPGFVCGMLYTPAHLDQTWIIAHELYLWSESRKGRALKARFEKWAHDMGAREIRGSHRTGPRQATLGQFFERDGYALDELHYRKRV